MTDALIFHLAEPSDWESREDDYAPAGFDDEGFIHCSTADQLERVAGRHYAGRDDLVLLAIDASSIWEMVVHEDLYETGEDFPHIYGRLPVASVVRATRYSVT